MAITKKTPQAAPPLPVRSEVKHPKVFQSFQDKVWAILPAKLDEIVAVVEAHLDGKQVDWPEAAAGKSGARAQDEPYRMEDGVAVIQVYGVLDKRMNLISKMSGGTSYELLGSQVKQALSDPKVGALLLDVDSPGGSVDGIKTVADQIYAGRGQKPIVAFANGQMTSAAYWIGSAAEKIVADDTAVVGSIGVVMTHFDRSGQDAQRGVKRTHIFSGKYKVAGSDVQPLNAEDQAYLQGISDQYYQLFLEGVAQTRGQDRAAVHVEMGEGRLFIGRQAKEAGLVDQIGMFSDALALAKSMALATGQGGMRMDRTMLESQYPDLFAEVKALGAAEVNVEALLAKNPQAAEKIRAEGHAAGVTEERGRAVEILEAVRCQGVLMQVIKEGSDPKVALKLFLDNYDKVKTDALAAMQAAAPPVVGTEAPTVETFTEPERDVPIETRAKAEWDKDPKLREQYMNRFEAFLAFKRGEEQGSVKIIGKG